MASYIVDLVVSRVTYDEVNVIAHSMKSLQYNTVYHEDRRDYTNNKDATVTIPEVFLYSPNGGVSFNIAATVEVIPIEHDALVDLEDVKKAVKRILSWKLDSWRIGFGVNFLDSLPADTVPVKPVAPSDVLAFRKLRSYTGQ